MPPNQWKKNPHLCESHERVRNQTKSNETMLICQNFSDSVCLGRVRFITFDIVSEIVTTVEDSVQLFHFEVAPHQIWMHPSEACIFVTSICRILSYVFKWKKIVFKNPLRIKPEAQMECTGPKGKRPVQAIKGGGAVEEHGISHQLPLRECSVLFHGELVSRHIRCISLYHFQVASASLHNMCNV